MHFYPHNIGDFNNSTRHLTRVERSVYRDAMEHYYDKECALQASDIDRLYRVLLCISDEEKAALDAVLNEFFTLEDGVYRHDRCDLEIDKYRSNSSAKAKAGRASAEARKNKIERVLNSRPTDVQLNNKQEPRTNNHKPITSNNNIIDDLAIETSKKRKSRIPIDFQLTDQRFNLATSYWHDRGRSDLKPEDEFAKFLNHFKSNGKTMLDWDACWTNWYSNAITFNRPPLRTFTNQPKTIEQTGQEINERVARMRASLEKTGAL